MTGNYRFDMLNKALGRQCFCVRSDKDCDKCLEINFESISGKLPVYVHNENGNKLNEEELHNLAILILKMEMNCDKSITKTKG